MRTKLQSIVFGGVALLVLAACSGKGEPEDKAGAAPASTDDIGQHTFGGDAKLAVQGRELFIENNCYSCHGGLAGGAMGPSLRDTTWKYGGSDSMIYHSIHDGRPMGMPPWAGRLNDRQIGALIEYIHSLRTKAEPQFFFAQGGDTTAMPAANAAPPANVNPIPMPGPEHTDTIKHPSVKKTD
ncbi:MAG: c-type cytochrome [Gemmatimonadaceae bacterium]